MACYHPVPAKQDTPGGPVKLWPPIGHESFAIPCGKCIGCRTARALQWAQRCVHESRLYHHNTFITLTYADEKLPQDGHLRKQDLQRFFKRLRKHTSSRNNRINHDPSYPIRYFACGEYGDRTQRPHYHAILFNCGFTDGTRVNKDYHTSAVLKELWTDGNNTIAEANGARANYIAQYALKKQGQGDHDADGVYRPAPFLCMSLKPAIGTQWLQQHKDDLAYGYMVTNKGKKTSVPRTYRKKLETWDPLFAEEIQGRITQHRLRNPTDAGTPARLADAETIHHARKQLTERRTI